MYCIEINRILKLSHCLNYWSVNAPGRSARSRPLAAARFAPVAPRTRTIGIDGLQNVFDNVCNSYYTYYQ